ncbi:MAG: MoxR family ATPase [Fimbriimonadia bacterium]|jgi:MoxR-like ATPase
MDTGVQQVAEAAERLRGEIRKAIAGQDEVVDQLLIALLADGHVLLEGVPGVAKTLAVRSLALACDLPFRRIQFTPDLMPSDITGTSVYVSSSGVFELRLGPIFTSVLLADEINRTPPKTQAALLEAMEERRVTIEGSTQSLPDPFIVFATQNPIEYEGTYPLPEAQLDRFLFKVLVDYPDESAELTVLDLHHRGFRPSRLDEAGIVSVVSALELAPLRAAIAGVQVTAEVLRYIGSLVRKTRGAEHLVLGGSPRAGVALLSGSKAAAALHGRDYVTPDDVMSVYLPAMRHRVLLRPEAEIEGLRPDDVLKNLARQVPVPR